MLINTIFFVLRSIIDLKDVSFSVKKQVAWLCQNSNCGNLQFGCARFSFLLYSTFPLVRELSSFGLTSSTDAIEFLNLNLSLITKMNCAQKQRSTKGCLFMPFGFKNRILGTLYMYITKMMGTVWTMRCETYILSLSTCTLWSEIWVYCSSYSTAICVLYKFGHIMLHNLQCIVLVTMVFNERELKTIR